MELVNTSVKLFCSVIVLLSALIARPAPIAAQSLDWMNLEPGLEAALLTGSDFTSFLDTPLRLIRMSPDRQRVRVVRAQEFGLRRSSAKEVCQRMNASVCVNASFFDELGAPLGVLVSRGSLLQKPHRGGRTLTGVFIATQKRMSVVHRSEFQTGHVLEAVQAGPRLLDDGKPVEGVDERSLSARTGLCIDKAGRLVLAVHPHGWRGITLRQFQTLLEIPALGCVDALNLDGGKSTQLFVNRPINGKLELSEKFNVPGFDDVPVFLAILGGR